MFQEYDVIVVGAGHAGCEAAAAAANMGSKVLLVTMDMNKIAQMSCNPAIGGVAKGQIVREIDALGGYSGIVTDKSMIQFRMLNTSKGPAMWSPRAQTDRVVFSLHWRLMLEETKNVDFWQDTVTGLIIEDGCVKGVKTLLGNEIPSKTVILTNGTFLNGLMHVGKVSHNGGRSGDMASYEISEQLSDYGFHVGRMKTGTPARIDARSIDFTKMVEQKGDVEPSKFSYLPGTVDITEQRSCYITYTNKEVHEILKTGFDDSPLFNGTIDSIGPRYCPSIEDKIITFSERDKHQLFLEPEGYNTIEYYINGFSSSLPQEVQLKAMRKIVGLENVKIFRPGYAIEYDYFPPTQLKHSLETKQLPNLYFAGQINGTTGYEEAAAQGLMAGINAHQKTAGKEEFILQRDEAYIGVLIDDLVTKGVDEPYRMFTSRAEYRILLRQDNSDQRLTERSYAIGLAGEKRLKYFREKMEWRQKLIDYIEKTGVKPEDINTTLKELGSSEINQKVKIQSLLLRPQVRIYDLVENIDEFKNLAEQIKVSRKEILETVEVEIKYQGYIKRERALAEKILRLENVKLSDDLDYAQFKSISTEARQKLNKIKPRTIAQAARISGVSPSDINVLLIHLGR